MIVALENIKDLAHAYSAGKVTSNSRDVKPGDVFVALKGARVDGHEFLHEAASRGALFLVGELPFQEDLFNNRYYQVTDSAEAFSYLSAAHFNFPSRELLVLGVTGTSGKTTTAYLLHSILKEAGFTPGLIGTVCNLIGDKVIEATHTTPDGWEVQKLFFEMLGSGCRSVVMEVSSHALKQKRVEHVEFDGAIFTNLSPEHLDYHSDMEDYYESKKILFTRLLENSRAHGKPGLAAIPPDVKYGDRLLRELGPSYTHSVEWEEARVSQLTVEGTKFKYRGIPFTSRLFARFNLENILGAITLAQALGISEEFIQSGVQNLAQVPGRLESVKTKSGVYCIVDYAHKPDAMEKVLTALREIKGRGKLITVFGCGGNRDKTKRPEMGRIATELSDQVWITSDNPRLENPSSIIEEIVVGIPSNQANYFVQADRKKAIEEAIQSAKSGDCVAILGKGHENNQLIADPHHSGELKKIPFDDREIARGA